MTRLSTSGFVLITFVTGAIAQAPKPAKHLQSRPRPPLAQLRFSPDGRYILAQDASGVTVLTVQPFAVYFRIPAGDADPAQFTPDSQQIVFVSSATSVRLASPGNSGHLERWNIADHSRVAFTEIRLHGCDTKELSPDGLVLACVDSRGTLRLLDIASGGTIFQKEHLAKEFVVDHPGDPPQPFGDLGSAWVDFSPDGHFVVVLPRGARGAGVAWDLHDRKEVKLEGAVRELNTGLRPRH